MLVFKKQAEKEVILYEFAYGYKDRADACC